MYYWQGRVKIQHGSAYDVSASVRGSRTYDVHLDWQDGALNAACNCAFFDSAPCKHLWALILAADGQGFLSAVPPDFSLDLDGERDDTLPADTRVARTPSPPAWKRQLHEIAGGAASVEGSFSSWPPKREVIYMVEGLASAGDLILSLTYRDRKPDGSTTHPMRLTLRRGQIPQLPEIDRQMVSTLVGSGEHFLGYVAGDRLAEQFEVPHILARTAIPWAAGAGRCYLRDRQGDATPLAWDDSGIWTFGLDMRPERKGWKVSGELRRGDERMDLADALLVSRGGFVVTKHRIAPLAEDASYRWIAQLRRVRAIWASGADQEELLAALLTAPGTPPLNVPEELRYEETSLTPRPSLHFRQETSRGTSTLAADLSFDYGGRTAFSNTPSGGFYDAEARLFTRRDPAAEKAAISLLLDLGLRHKSRYGETQKRFELAPGKLPRVVRSLAQSGWHIEADGKIFRSPRAQRLSVSTGVDWFELHGDVEYGENTARLPVLLEALSRGETMVRLDDGTYGLIPEEWLDRIGMLAGAGEAEDGHIRFGKRQAGLLDALLAMQPEVGCDEAFMRIREELHRFNGIEAADQPAGFVGTLRDYQREGLGWMAFLRRFSFGGCLADDMGVGKTAQVLALFETRRELRAAGEPIPPSLVVVPRSLVFNWKQEAERFTPQLRVLDYTGTARKSVDLAGCDVLLTTYGTLRRDAVHLKDVEFDYVVLDEAQAVKNASSESAKAVRLLRGKHRLALSGTPVENHLGELWSLFEFLNPGMLGSAGVFKLAGVGARGPQEETRQLLAHALRPFILRRTKEQVAKELPPKTEQTIYCEMESAQRKLYNELRQHYRDSLLKRIETDGLAKSKMQVLTALLRLRQAACHPGLLDDNRRGDHSAKLDVLFDQLREVIEEGHKALVFSQFTSLLSIVRERLDKEGVVYEYLDGATRDRQERVERFQNDPSCPLFLISLKAGGLGLNLTAAEYVFLLDPWWNPAVEAQAMDRAHRIGQTRQVFAYRLIARDTVEEKVLELQKTKRDLAAAILSEDNSLIRNLKREDLELLLS
jgi:superfamily II DNA or RNA helicase